MKIIIFRILVIAFLFFGAVESAGNLVSGVSLLEIAVNA